MGAFFFFFQFVLLFLTQPHFLCSMFAFQYKKPKQILTLEQELLKELKKLKGTGEGDVDCKTQ